MFFNTAVHTCQTNICLKFGLVMFFSLEECCQACFLKPSLSRAGSKTETIEPLYVRSPWAK